MVLLLVLVSLWAVVAIAAVALCVHAGRADDETADAMVPASAGRFRAVA